MLTPRALLLLAALAMGGCSSERGVVTYKTQRWVGVDLLKDGYHVTPDIARWDYKRIEVGDTVEVFFVQGHEETARPVR